MAAVPMPELAESASTPAVHVPLVRQSQRVELATGDADHTRVAQRNHALWRHLWPLLAMPKLAIAAVAESVEVPLRPKHARVASASHPDNLDCSQAGHQPRHTLRLALAMAQLPIAASPPRVDPAGSGQCRAMVRATLNLAHRCVRERRHHLRLAPTLTAAVTKLPVLTISPRV